MIVKHKKYGVLRVWFHMIKEILKLRHEELNICPAVFKALVQSTRGPSFSRVGLIL
jgi:hypothetical protein